MSFEQKINEMKTGIDEALMAVLSEKQPDSLYEPIRYIVKAGGKRLRPFLVQMCCMAAGGRKEDSFYAALAVELLHTFTLVHDDIMDHDDLRRGRPTVHKQWDEPTAILAGDGLVALGYQSLLKTKHEKLPEILKIVTEGLLTLCEGQALDKAFEQRDQVSLAEYEEMIEKKTACLIEVSCEIGALIGNASEKEQEAIRQFSHHLGRAFQIQDDLLDVISDSDVLGKPAGSDFLEKKKTYVTLHFFNRANPKEVDTLEKILSESCFNQNSIVAIRGLLERTGTIENTRNAVRHDVQKAFEQLGRLQPGEARDDLQALIRKIELRAA